MTLINYRGVRSGARTQNVFTAMKVGGLAVLIEKRRKMKWIDQYSRERFGITTAGYHGSRQTARVKTFGEVLREYEFHPEAKCADADGDPCGKQTVGLLQRRHIRVEKITYIGKESNKIEDVQSALIHSAQEVYTEYPDPRRDEWESTIRRALNKVPPERVAEMTEISLRTIIYARTGRRRPHPEHQELFAEALRKIGLIQCFGSSQRVRQARPVW